MGREQKGRMNGVGEGKEGNSYPQTPQFLKNAHRLFMVDFTQSEAPFVGEWVFQN